MTLRPGCAPARLLLELWHAQAYGNRWQAMPPSRALTTAIQKGFIALHGEHDLYTLTQAGRYAAQTLEAGSR